MVQWGRVVVPYIRPSSVFRKRRKYGGGGGRGEKSTLKKLKGKKRCGGESNCGIMTAGM